MNNILFLNGSGNMTDTVRDIYRLNTAKIFFTNMLYIYTLVHFRKNMFAQYIVKKK